MKADARLSERDLSLVVRDTFWRVLLAGGFVAVVGLAIWLVMVLIFGMASPGPNQPVWKPLEIYGVPSAIVVPVWLFIEYYILKWAIRAQIGKIRGASMLVMIAAPRDEELIDAN